MGEKSINWINVVKAFCIIFVFLRHTGSYYGYSMGLVGEMYIPFYVNAFFFVSGYLLFWKQLSPQNIEKSCRTYMLTGGGKMLFNVICRLVIPSILFSAIEFFPSCYMHGRSIDIGHFLFKTIGGGTYWFTSALVVAELILLLSLLTRIRNIWFYTFVCVLCGVIGLLIVKYDISQNGFWAWRQGLIAMIFLALGGLYWRYETQIDKLKRWWVALPLLLVYVQVILLCDKTNPLISTLQIQPLGFLTSTIACLLLIWLCKHMPEIKPLTFIGRNSIGFYFMSGALPITFSLIAHKLVAGSHAWLLLAVWIACLIVVYFVVVMINKWLPWLWDLRLLRKQE